MKHLLRYTLFLLTALLPSLAIAQPNTKNGATLNKYVTENDDGTYTISMETYATGSFTQTPAYIPTDFVLVLDNSGSMEYYSMGSGVTIHQKSSTKVSVGTTLSSSDIYFLQKDGLDYYFKYNAPSGGWSYSLYEDFSSVKGVVSSSATYTVQSSDMIYKATAITDPTRLQALRVSVASFLRLVYANNPSATLHHKVAIVWYGDNAKSCSFGTAYTLLDMNKSNMEGLVNAIMTETPDTGESTLSSKGLSKAYDILSGASADGNNKVVVFFTDGEPGSNSSFLENEARNSVTQANKIKKNFSNSYTTPAGTKTYPSILYSIGLGTGKSSRHRKTSSDSKISSGDYDNDKYIFMHYVSSNYQISDSKISSYQFRHELSDADCLDPDCPTSCSHHGNEGPHGYFTAVSDASALNNAFARIAERVAGGADRSTLNASSAVVVDVVTPQFTLPKDAKAEDVKLYTCAVNETSTGTKVSWMTTGTGGIPVYKDGTTYDKVVKEPVAGGHIEYWEPNNTAKVKLDKENRTVTIENFDFASNFVGPIYDVNDNSKIAGWTGQKLIAQFTIERDPSNTGGLSLNTNTKDSGLKDGGSFINNYTSPKVAIPTIIITKKGLAMGESAVFEVERVTSSDGTTPDGTNKFKNTYILTKTSSDDPTVNFVTSGPGYYKVTEKTWTWNGVVTYDKNDDGTPEENGTSYVQELTTTNLEKTFTFGVGSSPKTSVLPRYQSEKNKNNDFGTTTP